MRQRSIQAAEDYEGIVASLKEDLETYLDVLKNNSQARSSNLMHDIYSNLHILFSAFSTWR